MPVVRAAFPSAARRVRATFLPCQVQNDVLVSPAPLGRARGSGRLPDHRCHQERRSRSVHAARDHHLAVVGSGGTHTAGLPLTAKRSSFYERLDRYLETRSWHEVWRAAMLGIGWLAHAGRTNRDALTSAVVRLAAHALGLGPTR
jgi:hypothetical protein